MFFQHHIKKCNDISELTFGMCFHSVKNAITMWEINTVYPPSSMAFRNEKPVGRTEMNMLLKVLISPQSNSCSVIEQITPDPWCSPSLFIINCACAISPSYKASSFSIYWCFFKMCVCVCVSAAISPLNFNSNSKCLAGRLSPHNQSENIHTKITIWGPLPSPNRSPSFMVPSWVG